MTILANALSRAQVALVPSADAVRAVADAVPVPASGGTRAESRIRQALAPVLAAGSEDHPATLARYPWPELALALASGYDRATVPLTVSAVQAIGTPELTDRHVLADLAVRLIVAGAPIDGPTVAAALSAPDLRRVLGRTNLIVDSAVDALLEHTSLAATRPWAVLAEIVIDQGAPSQVTDLIAGMLHHAVPLSGLQREKAAARLDDTSILRVAATFPLRTAIEMTTAYPHTEHTHTDVLVRVLAQRMADSPAEAWPEGVPLTRVQTLAAASSSFETAVALTAAYPRMPQLPNAAYWSNPAADLDLRREALTRLEDDSASSGSLWESSSTHVPLILATLPADQAAWLAANAPRAAAFLMRHQATGQDVPVIDALAADEPVANLLRRPQRAVTLARFLEDTLGDRPQVWETALAFLPEWGGTARELVDAVDALEPGELTLTPEQQAIVGAPGSDESARTLRIDRPVTGQFSREQAVT
jgi:hypothetical protein